MSDKKLLILFIADMHSQGIETLEDLFTMLSGRERDSLVETICSDEFVKSYQEKKKED